jgi:hypothetical protein
MEIVNKIKLTSIEKKKSSNSDKGPWKWTKIFNYQGKTFHFFITKNHQTDTVIYNETGKCIQTNTLLYGCTKNQCEIVLADENLIINVDRKRLYQLDHNNAIDSENNLSFVYSKKINFVNQNIFIIDSRKIKIYDLDLNLVSSLNIDGCITKFGFTSKYILVKYITFKLVKKECPVKFNVYDYNFAEKPSIINLEVFKDMMVEDDHIVLTENVNIPSSQCYLHNLKTGKQTSINGYPLKFKNGILHVVQDDTIYLCKPIQNTECCVCFEEISEPHVLVPCGHTNLCTSCYKLNNPNTCPVCNSYVEQRIKIFK